MTDNIGAQPAWSYAGDPTPGPGGPRRRRRWLVAAAAVVVVLLAALVGWLVWPHPAGPQDSAKSVAQRPMLNDQPPTVILNNLDFRSLYPPGYVDWDMSKKTTGGPDDIGYDPDAHYETTSSPTGCARDPLFEAEHDFEHKDPDRYQRYPILLLMYPVDDPGGNAEDTRGFFVSVYPAPDPTSLESFRQWYSRCHGAKVTVTVTKDGQVIRESTSTEDTVLTEAPVSEAQDSFAREQPDQASCNYVGLVRGLIVEVSCPPTQRDAGAELYRTVIGRINAI
ncbi:hypothetical protein [Mycolicibacterium palauense]|uniref:hypothetical protein n=1 Tax=Mycolicibacterium palauense TaxID=2034511 RepID=UPI0011458061|nr:hypothetical protein [Mycolicibacterium palauense]